MHNVFVNSFFLVNLDFGIKTIETAGVTGPGILSEKKNHDFVLKKSLIVIISYYNYLNTVIFDKK